VKPTAIHAAHPNTMLLCNVIKMKVKEVVVHLHWTVLQKVLVSEYIHVVPNCLEYRPIVWYMKLAEHCETDVIPYKK
jgi:hypothetical protein